MSNVSATPCKTSSITTDCTVDAVIATTPAAVAVLNAYRIDTCCGGHATIGDAAAHAHVDPAVVIDALQAARRSNVPETAHVLPLVKSCGCGCR